MANTIAGMFADPNSFRDERLNDLMKQRQAIGQMGGSMNQLLGQVAAGGGATGAMMAEGLGGMFGMQTPEEAKAAEIQRAADFLPEGKGLDTAEGATFMAQRLNNLGYTAEAVKMLEHAQAMRDAELNRQVKEKSLKDRNIKVINSYYDPLKGVTVNEYGYWDPELGKVVKLSPSEAAAVEGQEGDVKIGTTAESLQESWGG